MKRCSGPLAKMHNLWDSIYNSNFPEPISPNLDVRVAPIGICSYTTCFSFPFLLVSAQRPSEDARVWIFAPKLDVLDPIFLGGDGTSRVRGSTLISLRLMVVNTNIHNSPWNSCSKVVNLQLYTVLHVCFYGLNKVELGWVSQPEVWNTRRKSCQAHIIHH